MTNLADSYFPKGGHSATQERMSTDNLRQACLDAVWLG